MGSSPSRLTRIMEEWFSKFSVKIAKFTGSHYAFILAVIIILSWMITGPYFNWSSSHSLFINTITTIATFLMVFLIQNTQNRDTSAIQIKLDALINAIEDADNKYIDIESGTEKELKAELNEIKKRGLKHDS